MLGVQDVYRASWTRQRRWQIWRPLMDGSPTKCFTWEMTSSTHVRWNCGHRQLSAGCRAGSARSCGLHQPQEGGEGCIRDVIEQSLKLKVCGRSECKSEATAFLKLIRWPNLLMMALTLWLIRYSFFQPLDIPCGPRRWAICSSGPFHPLHWAAGYVVNDLYDLENDRILKPERMTIGPVFSEDEACAPLELSSWQVD